MAPSRRRTPLVLILTLLVLALVPAGAASAETHRAQLTYTCGAAAEKHESQAVDYPFVAALQLDVPSKVKPGDRLTLSGTFSVQMPEKLRSLAAQYFTYAQAVSDSLTIPVVVGGRTTLLRASHFDSGKVTTKSQPLVLTGAVSSAPFTVPSGASSLRVELPANGSVPSNLDNSKVAFTAEALLSGGLVSTFVKQYVYKVACNAPAGAQRSVATVRIATPAKPSAAGTKGPKGTHPKATPTSSATPTATSTPTAAPTTTASARPTKRAASAPVPSTAGPTASADAAPTAAIPQREDDGGTPAWVFVVGVLVVVAGLGSAVWMRRRSAG